MIESIRTIPRVFACLVVGLAGATFATGGGCSSRPHTSAVIGNESTVDLAAAPWNRDETVPAAFEATVADWNFAAYSGYAITTPYFHIYTTVHSERFLRRLPIFLETAMLRFRRALADLPPPQRRVETFIFADRRQWTAKTKQILRDQAHTYEGLGRGGFTTRGISVLYDIDYAAGKDRDTLAIASHEGWHQYTQSTFRNPLPIWLEEGMATYMEGFSFRDNQPVPVFDAWANRERGDALKDAIDNNAMIPLAQLLSESPQSFLRDSKSRLLTYYAQVWALTLFLSEGAGGRYGQPLADVLSDAAEGRLIRKLSRSPAVLARGGARVIRRSRSGPWVILGYFTSDLTAFEQDYLAFAREIAARMRGHG